MVISHDLQGFIHPRWLLRDFLHQQYQWSYGPLPIPKNPGSPCQMMSKGCIITETKRKVFRFHDTILSLGEPGSLGWRFGALPTTEFSMVHFAPGFFFLQSSEPWKYNWVDLGNRSGSRNAVTSNAVFSPPGEKRKKKNGDLCFVTPIYKQCSWPFGRRTVRCFWVTFHIEPWLFTTFFVRHLDDLPSGEDTHSSALTVTLGGSIIRCLWRFRWETKQKR